LEKYLVRGGQPVSTLNKAGSQLETAESLFKGMEERKRMEKILNQRRNRAVDLKNKLEKVKRSRGGSLQQGGL